MKGIIRKLIVLTLAFSALMAFSAFAAGWTLGQGANSGRWWYDLGNGQYYGNESRQTEWQWLDGNGDGTAECYAFDSQGWMYADTVTPDGYTVNADGAWTVDGAVQTMAVAAGYAGTRAVPTEGKTLVVYFSATGNTERVAEMIAEAAGGDLFELEPADPYTAEDLNYNDDNSRVSREYADESLRNVELAAATVDGFDEYETVFIGYPVWWGIAAWPVNTFIEANDFTGKTVIPFCTSASSGLGESGELLAELAGTGNWKEGMRFRSRVSQEDVAAWVESLGL